MPEVFRIYGYRFLFYANDHEPVHVHVIGNEGNAKFEWSNEQNKFVMTMNFKIKKGDLTKIQAVIDENADIIHDTWANFFYGTIKTNINDTDN